MVLLQTTLEAAMTVSFLPVSIWSRKWDSNPRNTNLEDWRTRPLCDCGLAPAGGNDPPTNRLTGDRSTIELHWNGGRYWIRTSDPLHVKQVR